MKKLKTVILFSIVFALIISMTFFVGCNDKPDTEPDNTNNTNNTAPVTDDDYTLTLSGLQKVDGNLLEDVVIKKSTIKTLYETKPVIFDEDNPAVASDKQDDDGNLIPHTVKGVYLEDLLSDYTESAPINVYGSLSLYGTDGYVAVATDEVFDSDGRGSKMVIALELDGEVLTIKSGSGALRAIFHDQVANTWVKYLYKIDFSTELLKTPTVYSLYSLDEINSTTYGGQYTKEESDGNYTYYGLDISKMIGPTNILKGVQEIDKMSVVAWDYISGSDTYREYQKWATYDIYSNAYILTSGICDADASWTLTRTPILDGPAFPDGMSVKNVLSISVFHSAIVSFDVAMKRYDPDVDGKTDGSFNVKDLLILLNMFKPYTEYSVTKIDNTKVDVSYEQILGAKVTKNEDGKYTLNYEGKSIVFKAINVEI
ncbi:MAG TPA: molybdopterin-dependent oxidoreductase [Clostridia bacterium]|nr:molybdopterin-dependent oxidoreductase [Clostridia bacterium]